MASARSKVFNLITRALMRWLFRRPKPPQAYRALMMRLDRKTGSLPGRITVKAAEQPVSGQWLRNSKAVGGQIILYLHGGAFIMRLPNGHTGLVARLCVQADCSAFMPWYRLAPEHPFPAAPEDCMQAYRSLLDAGHHARNIVVMGDSAGGNLALVLPHLIRQAELPMPAGVIALSPITDFAQISATWRQNYRRDPMYCVQARVNPVEWYLQGASPIDPIASPYYGDFSDFPPLHFVVGGIEALLDDSIGMARKAIDCGVPAKVHIWQGMPHVFVLNELVPETALAMNEIVGWLRALRPDAQPEATAPLYRSCVEIFELQSFSGRLWRETNDVYLGAP